MRNKVVPAVLLPLVLVLLALVGCGAVEATAGNAVGVINGLEPAKKPHAVRITGALDGAALEKIGSAVRSAGERGVFVSLDLSGTTGLKEIGGDTFEDCITLTGMGIPEGVTEIGNNAFLGCTALARVEIPASVTKIGDNAFSNCPGLADIGFPDGWEGGELWFAVIGQTLSETVSVADFDFVGEWDFQFVESYLVYNSNRNGLRYVAYIKEEIGKAFATVTSGNATLASTEHVERFICYDSYEYEPFKSGRPEDYTASFDDENMTVTYTATILDDEPWARIYDEFVEEILSMVEDARVTTNSSKTAVKFEASDGEDKSTVITVKR